MTFNLFNLHPKILKSLQTVGYVEPTQIQSAAIPKIMEGLDVRASAQTGTGKTATFLLPAIHQLATQTDKPEKGARILILVPTRELAMQIATQAEKYSKYLNRIKTVCIVGGVPYPVQLRQLSRPHDIVIATPGRFIDLMERGKIKMSNIEMVVLDEADRMLDMGFLEPVETIVKATPKSRQTLLFSATLQGSVMQLSERLLREPVEIRMQVESVKHENIAQHIHYTDDLSHKNRLLDHILHTDGMNYAIIFTSTKRHANELTDTLMKKDFRVAALHGDMNQRQRTRTIARLRSGTVNVLVATDVAARGIDVQSITHVINYDLPSQAEDYVHRIGRTGRAGAKGTAVSFVSRRDALLLKKIEAFTAQRIDVIEFQGLEPKLKKKSPAAKRCRSDTSKKKGGTNSAEFQGLEPKLKKKSPAGKRRRSDTSKRKGGTNGAEFQGLEPKLKKKSPAGKRRRLDTPKKKGRIKAKAHQKTVVKKRGARKRRSQ